MPNHQPPYAPVTGESPATEMTTPERVCSADGCRLTRPHTHAAEEAFVEAWAGRVPTPYRMERKVPGYTVVIDHGPCEKVAVGSMCADCWLPLPEGHDWPQGETLLTTPASSASPHSALTAPYQPTEQD